MASRGIAFVVSEVSDGNFTLKDMLTGAQEEVSLAVLIEKLK